MLIEKSLIFKEGRLCKNSLCLKKIPEFMRSNADYCSPFCRKQAYDYRKGRLKVKVVNNPIISVVRPIVVDNADNIEVKKLGVKKVEVRKLEDFGNYSLINFISKQKYICNLCSPLFTNPIKTFIKVPHVKLH